MRLKNSLRPTKFRPVFHRPYGWCKPLVANIDGLNRWQLNQKLSSDGATTYDQSEYDHHTHHGEGTHPLR